MIKELVKKNRSYRRFYQDKKLTKQQLMELVEVARLTPSAANRQPFKYRIVCDDEENEKVFRLLGFAGYLKDWDGPSEGEKPTGYIVIIIFSITMIYAVNSFCHGSQGHSLHNTISSILFLGT